MHAFPRPGVRRSLRSHLFVLLVCNALLPAADEAALIGVLQSSQGAAEKDKACIQLRLVGTAKAVPALAALLLDKDLGFSARHALAAISAPEALAALRQALAKTEGAIKAGLVDSLGQRGDRQAIPELAGLLREADVQISSAAACSLGRIGGKEALSVLRAMGQDAPEALRPSLEDALLACAESFSAAGETGIAATVCKELYESPAPGHVRIAAFRRWVLSGGQEAGRRVAAALSAGAKVERQAALSLARELPGEEVTSACAGALRTVPPTMQVALIEVLAQRGDAGALPAILEVAASADPTVRLSALDALGALGNASVIPVLAKAAVAAKDEERKMALQSLVRLNGRDIAPALMAYLAQAEAAERSVVLEALRYRRETASVAGLQKVAMENKGAVREDALKALAVTADGSFLPAATKLLALAENESERRLAGELVAACIRQVTDPDERARPVLAALSEAKDAQRAALIGTLPFVSGEKALTAAREALADPDESIRVAAIRALSDWPDASAADDLLAAARRAPGDAPGILAFRGYLRLLALPSDRPPADTVRLHQEALKLAPRSEEKRRVLSSLGAFCCPEAVRAVEACLPDAELKSEACAALVAIAERWASSNVEAARDSLEKALAFEPSMQLREKATRILETLSKLEDHIVTWLVSGPYRVDGQGPQQLFDLAFDPEKPDAVPLWRKLERAMNAENPAIVDLQKALATENCVAYLKVQVVSPKAQDALLEVGSDDGVKIWLDGRLVHSANVMRPCLPGQDKVKVSLKEGANTLMLKITQGGMGWGASVRFRAADGSRLTGLAVQAR